MHELEELIFAFPEKKSAPRHKVFGCFVKGLQKNDLDKLFANNINYLHFSFVQVSLH